jgi:hypothetical protein
LGNRGRGEEPQTLNVQPRHSGAGCPTLNKEEAIRLLTLFPSSSEEERRGSVKEAEGRCPAFVQERPDYGAGDAGNSNSRRPFDPTLDFQKSATRFF